MGLNFNGGVSYSPINNEINRLNYNTSAFAVELHKTNLKAIRYIFWARPGIPLTNLPATRYQEQLLVLYF
ncbi:hypothetical protein LWM68_18390 [Niabella sp. W65]|nr:hypothetical protein [Niabella sp. W65]MCH7364547.1 hypothetical protein [Niabella sp. W65]